MFKMNLNEIECKQKELKRLKKQKQRLLSKEFRKQYKKWFLILDILMIFVFVHNSGAIMMTNALAVKESVEKGEDLTFYEANPAQQEIGNYVQNPDPEKEKETRIRFYQFIVQGMIWVIMIVAYISLRLTTYTMTRLYSLTLMVLFWFTITHWDFLNNLGYVIGKWKYG